MLQKRAFLYCGRLVCSCGCAGALSSLFTATTCQFRLDFTCACLCECVRKTKNMISYSFECNNNDA